MFDDRFFSTSVNKEELGELAQQLDVKYKHIYIQIGIEIYDASYFGLQEAISEVIAPLEQGSEKMLSQSYCMVLEAWVRPP